MRPFNPTRPPQLCFRCAIIAVEMSAKPLPHEASSAVEDYAKAIYALQRRGQTPASTNALAERPGGTPASASGVGEGPPRRGPVCPGAAPGGPARPGGPRPALHG